ncbi:MAG: PIN domain-containing protein [Candidatus Dadabacteria bacterium]|nr:PIN domain-containing protein [Candidatus Dadabacteria bacterium]
MTKLRGIVFDSSILIPYLRGLRYGELVKTVFEKGRGFIVTLVLFELYSGVRSKEDKKELDIIFQESRRIGRILSPEIDDWSKAGLFVSQYIRLYGRVEPRDHMNDLMIALVASKHGHTVITENKKHFENWKRIFNRSGIQLNFIDMAVL